MDGGELSPVRASDAERERAMVRLRDAAAEGRLTFEELADRVEAAGGAPTRAELEALTDDLPRAAAPPAGVAGGASLLGDLRRSGIWNVPAESSWQTFFGDVVLDLREAHVEAGEVTIHTTTFFGDVDVLVPEGVAVDVRTRTLLGDVEQKAGGTAYAGAPRVVLTGLTVLGDVTVRSRRLRERLLGRKGP